MGKVPQLLAFLNPLAAAEEDGHHDTGSELVVQGDHIYKFANCSSLKQIFQILLRRRDIYLLSVLPNSPTWAVEF